MALSASAVYLVGSPGQSCERIAREKALAALGRADAVSALGCGAGEPRYPASDYVLGAVDRRFRTIAFNH